MRTRVKFCGLVDSGDVDAAVQLGADAVGFVLWHGSSRALTLTEAASLRRRLPSWVMAVGLVMEEKEAILVMEAKRAIRVWSRILEEGEGAVMVGDQFLVSL